jgi:hypothetical protein
MLAAMALRDGICDKKAVGTALLLALFVFGVVFNNVAGSMMSYCMLGYPSWLLYGTTLFYTVIFGLVAVLQREHPCSKAQRAWTNQIHFLQLAALTAGNGVLFQFSAGFVAGDLSQLLSNMSMPAVLVLSLLFFRGLKFSTREVVGTCIVFAAVLSGSLVGLLQADDPAVGNASTTMATITFTTAAAPTTTAASMSKEQSNKWYWIMAFLVSTIFQALEQIKQEKAFEAGLSPWTCVFWYNLYSLPVYILVLLFEAVPVLNGKATGTTVVQAFVNQANAFRCFVGAPTETEVTSGACVPGLATVWPLVFVAGYVIFFGVGAVLIQRFSSAGGAFFVALITALGSPLAAAVFSIPQIVGEANYDQAKWYNYLLFFAVAIGVVVKGIPEKTANGNGPGNGKAADDNGNNAYGRLLVKGAISSAPSRRRLTDPLAPGKGSDDYDTNDGYA